MSKSIQYGLTPTNYARHLAKLVCEKLGYGNHGYADKILLETAAAETQLGQFPDNLAREGFGLTQFDTIGFDDVVKRTRAHNREAVKEMGYNLDEITPDDLTDDPLLAFIMTRLKYKLIPNEIPITLGGRAQYWKKHYNTRAGKGTPAHYLESAKRILYPEL